MVISRLAPEVLLLTFANVGITLFCSLGTVRSRDGTQTVISLCRGRVAVLKHLIHRIRHYISISAVILRVFTKVPRISSVRDRPLPSLYAEKLTGPLLPAMSARLPPAPTCPAMAVMAFVRSEAAGSSDSLRPSDTGSSPPIK